MKEFVRMLCSVVISVAVVGCRTPSSGESDAMSLVDAKVLRKSQIDSNYWLVDCVNGITETHTTAEVVAQKVCESLPVYQFYNPDRRESLYTTNPNGAGPNYGLRGVRFNVLPYAMTNESGQPLTQALTHCYDQAAKDHFLSVGNCNSPHESGSVVQILGYVLKPNQEEVGATMKLLRCVRPATANVGKDTKYSHDSDACQPGYSQVGSSMGIVLRKFPNQSAIGD